MLSAGFKANDCTQKEIETNILRNRYTFSRAYKEKKREIKKIYVIFLYLNLKFTKINRFPHLGNRNLCYICFYYFPFSFLLKIGVLNSKKENTNLIALKTKTFNRYRISLI